MTVTEASLSIPPQVFSVEETGETKRKGRVWKIMRSLQSELVSSTFKFRNNKNTTSCAKSATKRLFLRKQF